MCICVCVCVHACVCVCVFGVCDDVSGVCTMFKVVQMNKGKTLNVCFEIQNRKKVSNRKK